MVLVQVRQSKGHALLEKNIGEVTPADTNSSYCEIRRGPCKLEE